jgi:D-inositol-3-phosphate glycosyltransferase
MKIVHIVSTFPPHIGGMGMVCLEEVSRLSALNPAAVLTLSYSGFEYGNDKFLNFSVKRLRPLIMCGDAGWLVSLENYLKNCDIVHLHYPFYGALGSLIKCKKLYGFPLVVTYHMDAKSRGAKKLIQNIYDNIYGKKLFSIADKVIAVDVDHFLNTKFGRFIGKEKLSILPNGVDSNIFSPGGNNDWPVTVEQQTKLKNKKVVLFVGNFLPVKNLKMIIDAIKLLPANIILAVVGGGYEENNLLKKISKDNFRDRFVFLGNNFSRSQLANCYQLADVVVVPSIYESFSLVALEAMSCGAIVISSDLPGMRNRISDGINGFIAKKNCADEWASQIKKIIEFDSQLKIKIKINARETALAYNWQKHLAALNNIYRSIV